MAEYREKCSTSYVLIRLIENCKIAPDKKFITGMVLMDLPKASTRFTYSKTLRLWFQSEFRYFHLFVSYMSEAESKTQWPT